MTPQSVRFCQRHQPVVSLSSDLSSVVSLMSSHEISSRNEISFYSIYIKPHGFLVKYLNDKVDLQSH